MHGGCPQATELIEWPGRKTRRPMWRNLIDQIPQHRDRAVESEFAPPAAATVVRSNLRAIFIFSIRNKMFPCGRPHMAAPIWPPPMWPPPMWPPPYGRPHMAAPMWPSLCVGICSSRFRHIGGAVTPAGTPHPCSHERRMRCAVASKVGARERSQGDGSSGDAAALARRHDTYQTVPHTGRAHCGRSRMEPEQERLALAVNHRNSVSSALHTCVFVTRQVTLIIKLLLIQSDLVYTTCTVRLCLPAS
jgi:hypothetical protein